jgi:hypothetical protein
MDTFAKDDCAIPLAQVMHTSTEEEIENVPNEVNTTIEEQKLIGNREACRKIPLSDNW